MRVYAKRDRNTFVSVLNVVAARSIMSTSKEEAGEMGKCPYFPIFLQTVVVKCHCANSKAVLKLASIFMAVYPVKKAGLQILLVKCELC